MNVLFANYMTVVFVVLGQNNALGEIDLQTRIDQTAAVLISKYVNFQGSFQFKAPPSQADPTARNLAGW